MNSREQILGKLRQRTADSETAVSRRPISRHLPANDSQLEQNSPDSFTGHTICRTKRKRQAVSFIRCRTIRSSD